MPRPTSKPDLLVAIERERGKLDAVLETVAPERMVAPGVVGEWSVKDVLAHLYESATSSHDLWARTRIARWCKRAPAGG